MNRRSCMKTSSDPPGAPRRRAALALTALVLLTASCGDGGDDTGAPERAGTPAPTSTTETAPEETPSTAEPALRVSAVALRRVASVEEPTAMAFSRDGSVAYVAERAGRLWSLRRDGDRFVTPEEPALDLTDRVESGSTEQGLLGVAISPDGTSVVIDFIERGGAAGTSVIELYALDGDAVDAASRVEVLRVDQPFRNHNGGHVTFGPDGMLYIGFGDGGSQGDPSGNGQDTGVLLGKILRLKVSSGRPEIPADNPFVTTPGARPEIWLYGVRNPWRFSFDRDNGDLWIGDVGGSEREEIDHLPAAGGVPAGRGVNLGWQALEGTVTGSDDVAGSSPVDPVFEYSHDDGCSITGGYVYRGSAMPGLVGDYVFGDYCTARIWALDATGAVRSLEALTDQLSSFAEDPDGELYALSLAGEVLAITAG